MEVAQFGLRRRPFRPTPDTTCYCPTDAHEAALSAVHRAQSSGGGIAQIDGPTGTGKTLLGLRFLESLPVDTHRVIVHTPPTVTPLSFFQSILFDLGKTYQGLTEAESRLGVYGELLTALDTDRSVVILVDEAHHLTAAVLEEIRLLGNLESKVSKAVFVLLLGLATDTDDGGRVSAAFQHRVGGRGQITPLNRDESIRYLRHQIRECGGRPDRLLTDEALLLLADHCGGVPRVLNRAAGLALEVAATAGATEMDAEAVYEALTHLELLQDDGLAPQLLPLTPSAGRRTNSPTAQVVRPVLPIQKRPVVKKPKRKSA